MTRSDVVSYYGNTRRRAHGSSQVSDILEKLRANPIGWRIEDITIACATYGITCAKPKGGSHYKISHPAKPEILTIPFKRPIKPIYVRKLVRFIDDVRKCP